MADIKISAATDIATLVSTDMLPVARASDTSAYHATMAEVETFVAAGIGGVASWNTRTGAVTLKGNPVNLAGKAATWLLYASLAFVMVTREGTDWPLWIFWAGVVLAAIALGGYLLKARREVAT